MTSSDDGPSSGVSPAESKRKAMRPDAPRAAAEPVDLTNCDREPIHVPGAVQPHGVLLVLTEAMAVTQCSANAGRLLGVEAAELLGRPVGSLLAPASWPPLRE